MTLRTLKIILFAAAVLISISMFLAFLTVPLLGSIYLEMLKSFGYELPRLATDFALPMLRVDPAVPGKWPVNFGWVSLSWGVIIGAPLLIMIWSFKTSTVEACLARWSSGIMVYFPLIMSLFVAVLAGLLVSIAPCPTLELP